MPPWLPNTGLLREHHDYGTWCTDAPPIFHVSSMLTAMAAICADTARLVVDNAIYPLHVWAMMVGRSTADRKTTATRLAVQRVEKAVGNQDRVQRIYGSPEGILQGLVTQPCICLYVPEGGAFFAQREASYWKHARDIFMDLYDHTEVFERRLVKDVFRVRDPRISILAATAMPLLQRYTKDTDWLGGFLARFLMVGGEPMDFKKRFRTDPVVEGRIEALLRNVFMTDWGALGITTAARDILDNFAAEIRTEIDAFPIGLAPSLNRLPETANRFAALYEIAMQASAPPPAGRIVLVTADSAQCAVNLCRASRDHGLAGVAELTVETGWQRYRMHIEQLIRRSGVAGISKTALLRASRYRARDLNEILDTLTEAELIEYVLSAPTSTTRGPAPQKYMHSEAKTDAQRAADLATQVPGVGISYVNLATGQVNLGSLPSVTKAPPWACIAADEDESPGSGNGDLN